MNSHTKKEKPKIKPPSTDIFTSFKTYIWGRGKDACEASICGEFSIIDIKVTTEGMNKTHFHQKAAVCKGNSFNGLNIESPFKTLICLIKKLRDFHWGNLRSKE